MKTNFSKKILNQIKDLIDDHQTAEKDKDRINTNGEIFTPSHLVIHMLNSVPQQDYKKGNVFLEPACGDGQFVIGILAIKIIVHGMTANDAMKDIIAVDIMKDNVIACQNRCINIAKKLGKKLDPEVAKQQILKADFLKTMKTIKEKKSAKKSYQTEWRF